MKCVKCGAELPDIAQFCFVCGKKQVQEQRKHKKRANGTGNITKLSGGRAKPWLARRNGVCVGTFATRSEAQKALDRLVDVDVNSRFNMTFTQVYEAWLPEHERQIGATAKTNYQSAYKHCAQLHSAKYRSLRTSDFQKVIIDMEQNGLSKSSCEKVMQLFGQMAAWALREDVIHKDYSQFVQTVAQQKSEGIVLSKNAIAAIRRSDNVAADIILVLLATGCRPNELFHAKTAQCQPTYFIGGSKTEAGRNRIIAVAESGRQSYRKILEAAIANGSELLIGGYSGNKNYANFVKREFKELQQEVGEEFTPYDCRHTFATIAKRSGVDPQTLRRMLGHANLHTTDKYYTHLETEDILQGIAAVKIG